MTPDLPAPRTSALRLLVIGAHPDDCEYKAGGLAALYRGRGNHVKFISVTNGQAGHHSMLQEELIQRRRFEADRAASLIGAEADVWDYPDGRLVAGLDARDRVIRAIRSFRPDLLLTHRPNDYHPDHRYTSLLVQDACYLLTVPAICPDTPRLSRDPVVAYLSDDFQRPYPFTPSVVVDIGEVWEAKVAMIDAHESQFYEWLPFTMDRTGFIPEGSDARRSWLDDELRRGSQSLADRFRGEIVERYGEGRGHMISLVEAFEGCEYGTRLDETSIRRLFFIEDHADNPG